MAVISTLSILLKARTDRFRKGMKSAISDLKAVGSKVKWLVGVMGGLSALMLGMNAIRFKDMFSQVQKDADRVGKLSDEIGTTVNEMMGLEHAAKITGTTVSTMTRGLQRMNRRIGEAALGYGEGAKGIEQLGLKTEELLQLGAFDQFRMIAEQVKKMGTNGEKSAAVYAIFGRQGQNLINTFNMGAEGLQALRDQSEKLVGTYSRDEFRVFEEMNDAAVRLGDALKGFVLKLSQQFATRFGAALMFVTDLLVEIRQKHLERISQSLQSLIDRGIDGFSKWSPVVVGIGQIFVGLAETVSTVLNAMGSGLVMVAEVLQGLGIMAADWWGATTGLNEELSETHSIVDVLSNGMTGIAVIMSRLPQLSSLFLDSLVVVADYTEKNLTLAFQKFTEQASYWITVLITRLKMLKDTLVTVTAFGSDSKQLGDLFRDDITAMKELTREHKKTMRGIQKRQDQAPTLFDAAETAGLVKEIESEYNALLDTFHREARKRGGISSSLQKFLDKLKNFKFEFAIPPVMAGAGLKKAAEILNKFGAAGEFGSQEAARAMARNRRPAINAAARANAKVKDPVAEEALIIQRKQLAALHKYGRETYNNLVTATFN